MEWTATSILSGVTRTLTVPGLTPEAVKTWKSGVMIQDAMPDISPEWREFVMTGITPDEWGNLIGDEEDI